jgi:polyisoprenoid-binding protein YceI
MAAAVVAFSLLAPAIASAAEFVVQPERSELVVRLYKAGFASALAHDHVIRATRYEGIVRGDPGDPASASVEVTVQADSLLADEPEMRRKHGLTQPLSDSDRRDIQASMLGDRQLDVARHQTIAFRSTSVQVQGANRALLTGDFTLHGTTRRVTSPVTAQLSGDTFRATGSFDFNQSDFGIQPFSAFLGAVRNQDRITLIFDITAVAR